MASTLLTGLVSYYKLDGNSIDSVGSNTGTDTAISYSLANGKIYQGAGFNGSTSKIVKTSSGFPTGTAARSIALFMKENASATDMVLAGYGSTGVGQGFVAAIVGGKFYFAGQSADVNSNFTINDNVPHCCVVTYNGTTVTVYVDGVSKNTGTPTLNTTGTDFIMGQQLGGGSQFYDGTLDEVCIWSKALTLAEVIEFNNNGLGLQYPFVPTSNGFFTLK